MGAERSSRGGLSWGQVSEVLDSWNQKPLVSSSHLHKKFGLQQSLVRTVESTKSPNKKAF
jgi:hypothetical protein